MVDCGFAVKETVARLERVGVNPENVDAIIVTHEHGDHIGETVLVIVPRIGFQLPRNQQCATNTDTSQAYC